MLSSEQHRSPVGCSGRWVLSPLDHSRPHSSARRTGAALDWARAEWIRPKLHGILEALIAVLIAGLIAVLIAVLIAGLIAFGGFTLYRSSNATHSVAPDPNGEGCNGHVQLCDRGLDDVVFAATHNSCPPAANRGGSSPDTPVASVPNSPRACGRS